MNEEMIRQAHRSLFQRFFYDPLIALFVVFIWGFFRILPLSAATGIGGFLGVLAGRLASRRNKIARKNLEMVFPDKTERERERILKKMWHHWGCFFAEMGRAKELFEKAQIEGLDNLERLWKERGGFVCSAHIGNWEPAVSAPICGHYLSSVYRPANNPWLNKLLFQRRRGILIPKGAFGARRIIEVLRQKGVITILCDQKLREGLMVPFFGHPAPTSHAIATIALKLNVPIVMAKSIRGKDGRLHITVTPPLPIPSCEDPKQKEYEIMLMINREIETWIRETPEQWLWIHRRFDKSVYR